MIFAFRYRLRSVIVVQLRFRRLGLNNHFHKSSIRTKSRPAIESLERRALFSTTVNFPLPAGSAPGTIEAENYDNGGQNVAYYTKLTTNPGGAYRHDAVGVQSTTDAGGGYNLGWLAAGDWFDFIVNVPFGGPFTLNVRVASTIGGGTFRFYNGSTPITADIAMPNTGGWQKWTTLSIKNVTLSAGTHVIRLVMDKAATTGVAMGNFNWFQFFDNPLTNARTAWYRQAKYGMFIHWGLYSQLAGSYNGKTTAGFGEWIEHDLNISPSAYDQVAKQFNPVNFNAQTWVNDAKSAGMKYIVITTQHHDGFAMYNSKVNTFNVVKSTPWGQDPIAQLASASRSAGLHFGVYFSIMNWNHPELAPATGGATSPTDSRVVAYFNNFIKPQVAELINQYHPDILWFDGEWVPWWTTEYGRELTEYIRSLAPSIIINNRVGKRTSADGDFDTPEQVIPSASSEAGRLWETAATLNDTWGYKANDNTWKTSATVINMLAQVVSRGGNLLMNVGPDGTGVIPAPAVNVLNQVGAWLKTNASAIYNTTLAPITSASWGDLTESGNSLYAIIFTWPTTGTLTIGVSGSVLKATVLNTSASIPFQSTSTGITLTIPKSMPQAPATVIRIDFNGTISKA